jgi:hypothetical protein
MNPRSNPTMTFLSEASPVSASAFKATYSDWKLVRTRQVVQIVFEVPLADADSAYEILGGMPNSSNERWFGIAAIRADTQPKEEEEPQRRNWRNVQPSAQAAMRCDQPEFWAFLREEKKQRLVANKDDAATAVRKICGVNSRAHFNTSHTARVMWHQLDTEFETWKARERVGA